jgi:hypothetical protein
MDVGAFAVRRKNMFMGRWLRFSGFSDARVIRLMRPERITFERSINLKYLVRGETGNLGSYLLHYSFNKGITPWMEKHNYYSACEARESIQALRAGRVPWSDLFSADVDTRRHALKELSHRIPFRPLARFVYMYFMRFGFLDGWAGLTYCRLMAWYEYMIELKIKELKRREKGLPI